jgi:hypothetical protein
MSADQRQLQTLFLDMVTADLVRAWKFETTTPSMIATRPVRGLADHYPASWIAGWISAYAERRNNDGDLIRRRVLTASPIIYGK